MASSKVENEAKGHHCPRKTTALPPVNCCDPNPKALCQRQAAMTQLGLWKELKAARNSIMFRDTWELSRKWGHPAVRNGISHSMFFLKWPPPAMDKQPQSDSRCSERQKSENSLGETAPSY